MENAIFYILLRVSIKKILIVTHFRNHRCQTHISLPLFVFSLFFCLLFTLSVLLRLSPSFSIFFHLTPSYFILLHLSHSFTHTHTTNSVLGLVSIAPFCYFDENSIRMLCDRHNHVLYYIEAKILMRRHKCPDTTDLQWATSVCTRWNRM